MTEITAPCPGRPEQEQERTWTLKAPGTLVGPVYLTSHQSSSRSTTIARWMGEREVVDCSLLLWRHLEVELSAVRCRRQDLAAEGRPSLLDILDFGDVLDVPTVMINAMAGMERGGSQVEGAPPVTLSCPATSIAFHVIGRSCERWSAVAGLRPNGVTEIWRQLAGEVGRTAWPGGGARVLEQDTGLAQEQGLLRIYSRWCYTRGQVVAETDESLLLVVAMDRARDNTAGRSLPLPPAQALIRIWTGPGGE